jgi:two-component system phosphate regulon sensor histidine kinase PhoR
MRGKLFYKIFGTYLVIAVLAIGIVGFLAGSQIRAKLEKQIENELMAHAGLVDLYPLKEILSRVEEIARIARARVTVIDREGKVIAETDKEAAILGSHLERPEIQEARVRGKGSATRYSRTLKEEMIYVALPIQKGKRRSRNSRQSCCSPS